MRLLICACYRLDEASALPAAADALAAALRRAGHETDTIWLPFEIDAPRVSQLFGIRLLQFTDWCDRVIALDAPSSVVTHPAKTVWRLDDFALAGADDATLHALAAGWSEANPALSATDRPCPGADATYEWDTLIGELVP